MSKSRPKVIYMFLRLIVILINNCEFLCIFIYFLYGKKVILKFFINRTPSQKVRQDPWRDSNRTRVQWKSKGRDRASGDGAREWATHESEGTSWAIQRAPGRSSGGCSTTQCPLPSAHLWSRSPREPRLQGVRGYNDTTGGVSSEGTVQVECPCDLSPTCPCAGPSSTTPSSWGWCFPPTGYRGRRLEPDFSWVLDFLQKDDQMFKN